MIRRNSGAGPLSQSCSAVVHPRSIPSPMRWRHSYEHIRLHSPDYALAGEDPRREIVGNARSGSKRHVREKCQS